MVLPDTALGSVSGREGLTLEHPAGASGTRLKVAARPATVGATWMDLFHPGTPSPPSLEARVRVVADIAGALIQIHDNNGLPRPHRRHGRLTPRHVLIGVDGSASLFTAREPFSKLLPPQPDLGYLAPELLTQSGPATQQSDVFSLGALLWEALDNGRLFPHRRAAAISRLIARRSLPAARIEDEWALPLGEVAMKALSQDPDDRYADATAFWLALREHLPTPDAGRAVLSRLAQRALKLELTTDIRDMPPYLTRGGQDIGAGAISILPSSGKAMDEAPARYSLHPERSSRLGASSPPPAEIEDAAWALSEPPSPRVSQPLLEPAATAVHPVERALTASSPARAEAALTAGSAPGSEAPPAASAPVPTSEMPIPLGRLMVSAPTGAAQRQHQPAVSSAESPISTLHVNLPRELMDASMPFYVSSQPPGKPFPWGVLSFAALMFFGVGAAVAFGAVSALRAPVVREPAPAPAALVASAPPAAVVLAPPPPTSPLPAPPTPEPAPSAVSAAPVTVAAAPPSATTASAELAEAAADTAKADAAHKTPLRRAKAKPKRPKLELAPIRQTPVEAAPAPPGAELEQEPWSAPSAAAPIQPAEGGDTPAETPPKADAPPKAETPSKVEGAPKTEGSKAGDKDLPFVEQPY
jgi:hypothetical protein